MAATIAGSQRIAVLMVAKHRGVHVLITRKVPFLHAPGMTFNATTNASCENEASVSISG